MSFIVHFSHFKLPPTIYIVENFENQRKNFKIIKKTLNVRLLRIIINGIHKVMNETVNIPYNILISFGRGFIIPP